MGSVKENHLQREESHLQNLADALGIEWQDLETLTYDVNPQLSKDGLIYGYTVIFDESTDSKILSQIEGINAGRTVYLSPWVFERSYDEEYELRAISERIDHEASFFKELESTVSLQNIKILEHDVRKILLRQIFITIIGSLETFLSDLFISKILSSEVHLENFVSNHPELRKQKISVSEIYNVSRNIKEHAKTILANTIFHKLPVVKEMYEHTFEIEFPDISEIQKFVLIRHDLVHRNGKTVEGNLVNVTDKLVNDLREKAEGFVNEVVRSLEYDDDIPF